MPSSTAIRRLALGVTTLAVTAACGTTVPLSQQRAGEALANGTLGTSSAALAPSPAGGVGDGAGSSNPGAVGPGTAAGTSGTTGTVGPIPTAEASGPVTTMALPSTGPGWDARSVYVGFPTENDATQAAATLGYKGIDFGDMEGNVRAVVAAINAAGGVFGRRVVPVFHDNSTAQLLADPNTAAQSNCTYFSQDKRVAAVVNLLVFLDVDSFRTCMAKAKIPVFAAGQITDDVALRQLGGLYLNLAASYTSFTPVLMQRLKAQGFFSGWDVTTSKPNTSPVKVGLLIYSAGATERRVGQLFAAALKQAGHTAVDTFEYTDVTGSQMPSAVLKFRSDGVTHVFDYTGAIAQFMTTADRQQYHPRYALVSSQGPRDVIAGHVPNAQLVGAMGTGFCPVCEVPGDKDPNDSPGVPACKADLAKAGIRYEGESRRSALGIAYATCDGLKLIFEAFKAGGGLGSASLVAGLDRVGKGFATARSFRSGISRTRPALPAKVRDFSWNPACTCFAYGPGTSSLP